jgi:hypothetical protein
MLIDVKKNTYLTEALSRDGTLAKVHSLAGFADTPPFSAIIDYGSTQEEVVVITDVNEAEGSLAISRTASQPYEHAVGASIYSCLVVDVANLTDGTITAEKLEVGLVGAGLVAPASEAVDHSDAGTPVVVVAANGEGGGARQVAITIRCNEVVSGTELAPDFQIGETDTIGKFASVATMAAMTLGQTLFVSGVLAEQKALICTVYAGIGDVTGNFTVSVLTFTAI